MMIKINHRRKIRWLEVKKYYQADITAYSIYSAILQPEQVRAHTYIIPWYDGLIIEVLTPHPEYADNGISDTPAS
ncbi:hypothetical protein HDR63_01625 [bacterium]|nr:hypothetical protein [bacterium]